MSEKLEPLYRLTRKDVKFNREAWTQECEDAFQYVKTVLSKRPILVFPDFTKTFYVMTDASLVGIGGRLVQFEGENVQVIEYWSRTLNAAERNYSAGKREALAVTQAILRWKYYLQSQPFEVMTDHKPLLAFHKAGSSGDSYLLRWRLKLSPFTFKINWKPGSEMLAEDCLSRDDRHENCQKRRPVIW